MVGKGVRRRERNYRAAHGGDTRLPPPPKLRELDALPSKLRRLMAFNSSDSSGAPPMKEEGWGAKKRGGKDSGQKEQKKHKKSLQTPVDGKALLVKHEEAPVANEDAKGDASKGKRKRGKVVDLRFKDLDENVSISKKKKRMNYLAEKKKKRKHSKIESTPDFPGREQVRFGEVVEAPPKLSFPKVRSPLDASHERLREMAIEHYRNMKGWKSRPGIQLPNLAENTAL